MNAPVLASNLVRTCAFALAFTLASVPGGGVLAAPTPSAETSVENRPPAAARVAPRQATPSERASYASREQKASPELARFTGGDRTVLVLTSTTVVIILLVVLIVVLI